MNITVYSQKTILSNTKDTLICFTINQSKFLLKEHYKLEKCDTLFSICELKNSLKDSVIKGKNLIIQNHIGINKDLMQIITLKDEQFNNIKTENLSLSKQLKWQKIYKFCAIIGGGLVASYLSYKLIIR